MVCSALEAHALLLVAAIAKWREFCLIPVLLHHLAVTQKTPLAIKCVCKASAALCGFSYQTNSLFAAC